MEKLILDKDVTREDVFNWYKSEHQAHVKTIMRFHELEDALNRASTSIASLLSISEIIKQAILNARARKDAGVVQKKLISKLNEHEEVEID